MRFADRVADTEERIPRQPLAAFDALEQNTRLPRRELQIGRDRCIEVRRNIERCFHDVVRFPKHMRRNANPSRPSANRLLIERNEKTHPRFGIERKSNTTKKAHPRFGRDGLLVLFRSANSQPAAPSVAGSHHQTAISFAFMTSFVREQRSGVKHPFSFVRRLSRIYAQGWRSPNAPAIADICRIFARGCCLPAVGAASCRDVRLSRLEGAPTI